MLVRGGHDTRRVVHFDHVALPAFECGAKRVGTERLRLRGRGLLLRVQFGRLPDLRGDDGASQRAQARLKQFSPIHVVPPRGGW